MTIEPTTIAGIIFVAVLVYQQYRILGTDRDLDELISKHNAFVEDVAQVFDGLGIEEDTNAG